MFSNLLSVWYQMLTSLDVLITNLNKPLSHHAQRCGGMLLKSSIFNVKAPDFLSLGLDELTYFEEIILHCQV